MSTESRPPREPTPAEETAPTLAGLETGLAPGGDGALSPDGERPTRPDAAVPEPAGDVTLDDIAHGRPPATRRPADEAPTRREEGTSLADKIRADLAASERRERKDTLLGETIGGRFQVLKKIGAGGMGAVYRARQEGMDRDVAVKVLLGDLTANDTVLRRFTLEALAVSRLKHPNTIQIFDYGQTPQGHPYIAMELLEGQSLHELLRRERPLPVRRALRILGQVASSLAEAHGKGIVHRDLKPENIFLVEVGDNHDFVKVLDFGVAKLRDTHDDKGTLTQAGSIFGTPRYMSPEQCGAQPVDGRSDLYALGVILYEMLTGRPPFQSDQPLQLLMAHMNEVPQPPSAATDRQVIPEEVEGLVLQLLAKAPEQRVQQATELARICNEWAITLPAAFEGRLGSAEAETLGVRLATGTALTLGNPTARTAHLGEQPTVLGAEFAAAAPVAEPPAQPGQRWLPWLAVGGVLAVGLGWLALRPAPAPQVIEKQVLVERTLEPDMMEITVVSQPVGAFVNRGTDNIGVTPYKAPHKKGKPPEQWTVLREGYEPKTITVRFDDAGQAPIQVVLTRLPQAKPAPPPPSELAKPVVAPRVDKPKKPEAKAEAGKPAPPKPQVEPGAVEDLK
jgi:serine/threonine-protein kinase